MSDLLDLDRPLPYRRTPTGQRLCNCPSGPCERVAEVGGVCVPCATFCALRDVSKVEAAGDA